MPSQTVAIGLEIGGRFGEVDAALRVGSAIRLERGQKPRDLLRLCSSHLRIAEPLDGRIIGQMEFLATFLRARQFDIEAVFEQRL